MSSRLIVSVIVLALLGGCGPSDKEIALGKQTRQLQEDVQALTAERDRLQVDLAAAQGTITALRGDLELATAAVASRDDALAATARQHQQALAEAASREADLKAELADTRAALQQQVDAATARARMLADTVQANAERSRARIAELESELADTQARAAALGARLSTRAARGNALEGTLGDERAALAELADSSATTIEALRADLATATDRIAYLLGLVDSERNDHDVKVKLLEADLARARDNASRLGAALAARVGVQAEQPEPEAAATDVTPAVAEAPAATPEPADADSDIATLRERVTTLRARLEAAHQRSESLLQAVAACQRELGVQSSTGGQHTSIEPVAVKTETQQQAATSTWPPASTGYHAPMSTCGGDGA